MSLLSLGVTAVIRCQYGCLSVVCMQYSSWPGHTQHTYSAISIRYLSSARGKEVVEVHEKYRPRPLGVRSVINRTSAYVLTLLHFCGVYLAFLTVVIAVVLS